MYSKENRGSTAATRVAVHYDVEFALNFMSYQYVTECANCSEMLSFHVRALSACPIAPRQLLVQRDPAIFGFGAAVEGASGIFGDGDDPLISVRGSGDEKPVQAGTLIVCQQRLPPLFYSFHSQNVCLVLMHA